MTPTTAAAASGQVTIEKSTNGVDADSAPGPVLDPGTVVTWSYLITVGGDEILYDLIISDSSGVVPSCDIDGNGTLDGTDYHPGPVAPGQSFVCGATGVVHGAQEGGFTSTGAVRAFDYSGEQAYEDEDRSHYTTVAPFNASPKMSMQTLINGGDADSSPGPYIAEGTPVVLTYVVTNSGNVPLTSISVANDAAVPVDCGGGSAVIAGPVAPGNTVTCTSSINAALFAAGTQTTSGTASASAINPTNGSSLGQLNASDPSVYTPVQLPAALAFTGPSQTYAVAGFLALAAGLALLLARSQLERRATAG
ncbi:MAG: DUF7507 domain-containing protein [Acidimicrobiales bacterium]